MKVNYYHPHLWSSHKAKKKKSGGLLFTSHWLNLQHWTGFYIAVYGNYQGLFFYFQGLFYFRRLFFFAFRRQNRPEPLCIFPPASYPPSPSDLQLGHVQASLRTFLGSFRGAACSSCRSGLGPMLVRKLAPLDAMAATVPGLCAASACRTPCHCCCCCCCCCCWVFSFLSTTVWAACCCCCGCCCCCWLTSNKKSYYICNLVVTFTFILIL